MLPFLKNKTWPRLAKPMGESRYGYSEDDDLIEQALDELMSALAAKDPEKIHSSIEALIQFIHNRESGDASLQENT